MHLHTHKIHNQLQHISIYQKYLKINHSKYKKKKHEQHSLHGCQKPRIKSADLHIQKIHNLLLQRNLEFLTI